MRTEHAQPDIQRIRSSFGCDQGVTVFACYRVHGFIYALGSCGSVVLDKARLNYAFAASAGRDCSERFIYGLNAALRFYFWRFAGLAAMVHINQKGFSFHQLCAWMGCDRGHGTVDTSYLTAVRAVMIGLNQHRLNYCVTVRAVLRWQRRFDAVITIAAI